MGLDASLIRDEMAERSVLGACFLDGMCVEWLELDTRHFADPRNKAIWEAMAMLSADRVAIDELTVGDALRQLGRLEQIGIDYLAQLVVEVPTADNVDHYANILRRKFVNRQILNVCAQAEHELMNGSEGEVLLDRVVDCVAKIDAGASDELADLGSAVGAELRQLFADLEAKSRGRTTGVATGVRQLDARLGGLPRGVVSIIGARPGKGKSTLALTIADHASKHDRGVHVLTYEDRRSTFSQRALALYSSVDVARIRSRDLSSDDVARITHAVNGLSHRRNLCIDHAHGMRVHQLVRRVRSRRRELKTELVIVDYVQLMPSPLVGLRKNEQVEENMNALTELAGADDLAVLVVSQLNRDIEKREESIPMLADFRDSGSLEQVGKVVLGLFSPKQDPEGSLGIAILKNHQGPLGRFTVTYDKAYCRIG